MPLTELDLSLSGGLDFGLVVSSALWGAVSILAIIYYRQFGNSDPLYLKLAVALTWACTATHIILQAVCLHEQVLGAATFNPVTKVSRSCIYAFFGFAVQITVQSVYALRIYKFYHNYYGLSITVACWVGSVYYFIVQSLFLFIPLGTTAEYYFAYYEQHKWMLSSGYTVTAAVDMFITASLFYLLRRNRGHAVQKTLRVLNKLSLWTLETGLVTSLMAITIVILFNATAKPFYITLLDIIIPMYALTMYALLIGRVQLRHDDGSIMTAEFSTICVMQTDNSGSSD